MTRPAGDCWVITDTAAGNQRQALALAEMLGLPVRHLQLEPRAPWSWLSPRLAVGARLALSETQRRQFQSPWPSVAIGCGRQAAMYTRLLRRLGEGRCFTVQILDPRIDPAHWDLVIAPRHDGLAGPHVVQTLGSLNPVDDGWLQDGRDADPGLARLPGPRVGVLLGGPRRGVPFDEDYIAQLADHLLARQQSEGGSLLALASRRTPRPLLESLRERLATTPGLVWGGQGDGGNPYPSVLGWADRLVVTPDSVNMLSEACAVGCPVHTFVLGALPEKLARFHRALREAGRLHDIDATATAPMEPLRETAAIAAMLRERLAPGQPRG